MFTVEKVKININNKNKIKNKKYILKFLNFKTFSLAIIIKAQIHKLKIIKP